MSENVIYQSPQVKVTDRLLTINRGTTLSIASVSSVILKIERNNRGGLFSYLFGPDRTAKLCIELNTGIVHELASEDVAEIEKVKAAIEEAISSS